MSSPFNLSPWFTVVLTRISSVFKELITRSAYIIYVIIQVMAGPESYIKRISIAVLAVLLLVAAKLES